MLFRSLVASDARSDGNDRMYRESDIHNLRFIGRARALGFSMEQIRGLLGLWQNKRSARVAVKAIALQRIQELDARIAAVSGMRDTLLYLAQHCDGDDRPACPILEAISSAAPRQLPAPQATRH